MAIDSAEKRKAISGVGIQFTAPGVTPNANEDAEWRQQAAWSYSGITIGGVVVVPLRTLMGVGR